MLLRARIVMPIVRPAIENGAVRISGNAISFVGPFEFSGHPIGEEVVDLGDAILLPGLVNAHCHLDYTDMAGELPPSRSFADWIKAITTAKSGLIYADFARAWLNGARMLERTGTTTVADIETVPELLPEVWDATPLRVHSFLEMTGVRSRRDPAAILGEAVEKVESLAHPRSHAGLSPHAPYSTALNCCG
jgi:cytosine/adenosine deaminase-related metal-dependent hydrolase